MHVFVPVYSNCNMSTSKDKQMHNITNIHAEKGVEELHKAVNSPWRGLVFFNMLWMLNLSEARWFADCVFAPSLTVPLIYTFIHILPFNPSGGSSLTDALPGWQGGAISDSTRQRRLLVGWNELGENLPLFNTLLNIVIAYRVCIPWSSLK